MTSDWESVDVPNLFFCGTLTQARDFKRASSAFIAGFRYNTRTLHRFLRQRDEGQPLASTRLALDADALAEAVLARVNRTAALWVQFGYLCDAIVLKPSDGCARYYEEVPRDYVFESRLDKDADYFVIDFEWGKWAGDVFAIDRHPEHGQAHTNVFVHPIVRAYHNGEQIAEHHILEDLLGMFGAEGESGFVAARSDRDMRTYHRDEHEKPLKAFFTEQLAVLDTGDPHPISVAGS